MGQNEPPASNLLALCVALGLPNPTEGFWKAEDGARLRYAFWTTSSRESAGAVLCLNGRTEFIEKTIEIYALLLQSGLDVWTLDWRGQGLSDRALDDPHKGHITDYHVYLDDLDRFVHDVTDLPDRQDKKLMLAHSMGAHIGLRYLHDRPGLIDAAVFSAPMIDIGVNKAPLRHLNRAIVGCGFGESYALGTGRFKPVFNNPKDPADNGTLDDYRQLIKRYQALASDVRKRAEIERCVRDNPALALGGPTSAWLDATFRSIATTWVPGYAESIQTPVLMVGGGRDTTVVNSRMQAMAKRLPHGSFQCLDQGAHELLVECDDVRLAFLEAFGRWTNVRIDLPTPDMTTCARR